MLQNLSVNDFIQDLASNSPAPGGGSAAALSTALAAALSSMVFNLTVGKKVYVAMEQETRNLIDESLVKTSEMKDEFLNFMEKDTEAFLSLMQAFKLPKETEEEKALRSEKIRSGYEKALQVPMELAEKGLKLYEAIEVAAKYGNINAISDAGVAALLLQASIESAILNVKINLPSIGDEALKEKISSSCMEIVSVGEVKKKEILEIVNSKISG